MDKDMSVREFAAKLQEAGVNASFDEGTGRFFISAKDSGVANDFKIVGNGESGISALQSLGLLTKTDEEIAELNELKSYANDGTYDKDKTKAALTETLSDWKERYTTALATQNDQNADESAKAAATKEIESIKSEIEDNAAFAGLIEVNELDGMNDSTIAEKVDDAAGRVDNAIKTLEADATEGAHRVVGEDAEIYLNGAMFKSDTNSFTINGLNINLTGVTGDDEITISTTTDTDAIYDKVKDFMSQYSDLVNELQGLYNADAAKDYEPLTEEQKDEMSDTEIEKWETKIKDSLLRRDSTLNGVISTMTMAMSQNYSVTMKDGSKQTMALTSLGIHTLGIMNAKANEQYAYHIDGDEDDASTSGKQDKLRAMIESDPDAVADLMSQVAQGLYKALDTKIGAKTTELSSAYTIYNDKQMKSQAEQYKKDIKQWEERIADSEDAYYKQFTAMEKALASLNSSQSALTGMIG